MKEVIIDPTTSRYRLDLRCNSPYCAHHGKVVQLYGVFRDQFWCTECGHVSFREHDFRLRTGPLRPFLAKAE